MISWRFHTTCGRGCTWLSPIVVIPKKNGKFNLCGFQKAKWNNKKRSFSITIHIWGTKQSGKMWCKLFLDGYLGYHKISIDKYNTTFVTNWGAFIWRVMFLGMKYGPPTYQKAMKKTFKKYLDNFMKMFMVNFIVYNDMEMHLQKLILCFQKSRGYNVSLNPQKCNLLVVFGIFLHLLFKIGNLPNSKKL